MSQSEFLRSFGRRRGRPLKPRQADRLAGLLPSLTVPLEPASLSQLLAAWPQTWLEIGFGGGEHLAAQAAQRPDVLFLGAEPFVNGVASALRHIAAGGLQNVRLHPDDIRELVAQLPDGSISRVFILFPDPWPKTRHQKRRLVEPAFVAELARACGSGAVVRFATDWADYADQALETFTANRSFDWLAEQADDWRRAPPDHVSTRYEVKRLGDCAPQFLEFRRRVAEG
ncbi:MAG TPA: tRNA (guanosine(46)-N7)-methyltransferase TrmB [Caulobacteraceae bacterium]|nr:tRNA (guanosine(46)-N7)-methyltransferase TrmB [Caulobacteraceae bacterium]